MSSKDVFLNLFLARKPPMCQGPLIQEVARSHSDAPQSVGLLWSSSQRPLTDNTQHLQKISIPQVGFEPTISVGERPQTYAIDRAATGTGRRRLVTKMITINLQINSSHYTAINSLLNVPKIVDIAMTVFCKIFRIPNCV